ncbi:cobalamin biosynthesis protein [Thiohalobacter sp. IOR34]|uniref:cobalt-precorrin 5A hydrolase n=1 Tax=Thiohalobacter sp. IOR34 TaxID=3057176 RepID=UPI0025B127CC|nr:cobalamin biosynthesis protein [Thiohalobacter sp. IOR34]WJW75700.1 cobalamin biosynthesis protein [Thiohalobacter sp. IOR34]
MSAAERVAMVAITRHGAKRLAALGPALPEAALFISARFADEARDVPNEVHPIKPPFGGAIGTLFREFDQLVFVFSIGAAVRLIAPHLKGKDVDPGVVVVDDAGRFVIPVLSGHLGGANAFAEKLAGVLGALPVLTTASESLGTLPVDILGREWGWQVSASREALVHAAADVVNGEPVALVQECGTTAWWPADKPLPDNIHRHDRLEAVDRKRYDTLLWITHREVPAGLREDHPGLVIYRPPVRVVLGLGCDRDTPAETIETAISDALARLDRGPEVVVAAGSIDRKSDEAGLLRVAERHGWKLHFHTADELARIEVPNPSETVRKYMGTPSVAEAAALILAGGDMRRLLIEKHKHRGPDGRNATVSIAWLEDA